ncbi:MAG: Mur ligase family protein, partial [bacterium]|nr:Mur ligase family protein [bacterium]
MKLANFKSAQEYLYSYIPESLSQTYSADWGLARTKYFLELLGNPQEKIKVIHIAGTSGKGSTAYLVSLLLSSLGQKSGLSISPHLIDIRERTQINNQLISQEKFTHYLNKLVPVIDQVSRSKFGKVTYFELLTVLAFYIFFKEKVEFAVMETGMGGLYDATNSVSNKTKVAMLTKIGLDHTNILGKTIGKIALQKAEIIQNGNVVFSTEQLPQAKKVVEKIAKERSTNLFWVKKGVDFTNVTLTQEFTTLRSHLPGASVNIKLGMLGNHQAENCSLALATIYYLAQRDQFEFDIKKIKAALESANFPGRMEIKKINNEVVIIDGAHNPQKMATFLAAIKKIFPNQKFNFLIAFKKCKYFKQMLRQIVPLAKSIFITSFFTDKQDLVHLSQDPQDIAH